jgi:hypothetical protein
MSRIFVTFGIGPHEQYLSISRPGFIAYAKRHGYAYQEIYVPTDRPPAWGKICAIQEGLSLADEVLWVDADVVIVDGSTDVVAEVEPNAIQALVVHHQHRGFFLGSIASTGVWLVRQAMRPMLGYMWGMTEYLNHPFWEQAALIELMGYSFNGDQIFPVTLTQPRLLYRHTHFLGEEWNSIDTLNHQATPRFMHAPALTHEQRLAEMRYWASRNGEGMA